MRNKFGNLLIFLGAALMISALVLFLFNQQQAQSAQQAASDLMEQLVKELEDVEEPTIAEEYIGLPLEYMDPAVFEMTEVEIDGHAYIGYLSIPTLGLELPVMSEWSYEKLRIAPCRYYGTVMGEDLVVMAHNYRSHFARIYKLREGDLVSFVDMDGVLTEYQVTAYEVLPPDSVEEVIAGNADLTLFTCTYAGSNRVIVYCDEIN